MDSLSDILGRQKLNEPSEIKAIKGYVDNQFQKPVEVIVKSSSIIISANSAGLISTLRLQTLQIQKVAQTSKKLIFRIV